MSKPGNAVAQGTDSAGAAATTEPTFEQQVNEVVGQLTKDEQGIWQLPDNLEAAPEVKFAATLEKRRRDTESALGITKQKLKTETKVREGLEKRAASLVPLDMTEDERESLEVLKLEDPEAWRKKINALEKKAADSFHEEQLTNRASVSQETELERRASVLEKFNVDHPDAPITDEVLANDIPPRITRELEKGDITFEDFLKESYNFLVSPKVVKDSTVSDEPDLGKAGGGAHPSDSALHHQDTEDYSHAVF